MRPDPASFRDDSGYVYTRYAITSSPTPRVYRLITQKYAPIYEKLKKDQILERAQSLGMISYTELPRSAFPGHFDAPYVLEVPNIPVITYPYEWSFSQLKRAALMTLALQDFALKNNYVLKDASAYNVQFANGHAVFIDLLSFEPRSDESPWEAYGQFCRHFLAPLALLSYTDTRLQSLMLCNIDGIPLDLACKLLPFKAKMHPGLALHLFFHAHSQKKYEKIHEKTKPQKITTDQLLHISQSLRDTCASLKAPTIASEWGDYYQTERSYTEVAEKEKKRIVREIAEKCAGDSAIDVGANTGRYTNVLGNHFTTVLALDMDRNAVETYWNDNTRPANILPLVYDLANPSPGIGWLNTERSPLHMRIRADFILALAVTHHLRITYGIPFSYQSAFFLQMLKAKGHVLIEYVGTNDQQFKILTKNSKRSFFDYSQEAFIEAFTNNCFTLCETFQIPSSDRTLFLFEFI